MRTKRERKKGSAICNTCGEKSDFLYKLNSILDTLRFLKCPTRCLSIHIPKDDPSLSSSIQPLSLFLPLASILSPKYSADFATGRLKLHAVPRLFTCRGRRKLLATARRFQETH